MSDVTDRPVILNSKCHSLIWDTSYLKEPHLLYLTHTHTHTLHLDTIVMESQDLANSRLLVNLISSTNLS